MFVHIRPDETATLQRIPRALLFPAPGLPKGHVLLGYDDQGQCPMLVEGNCSIYDNRPQTCRDYDCRIFAATGIPVEPQSEIAQRVTAWRFRFRTAEGRAHRTALQNAAAFLQVNRDLFPKGSLPSSPGPLAAVSVRIYQLFAGAAPKPNAAAVRAIMEVLTMPATSLPPNSRGGTASRTR